MTDTDKDKLCDIVRRGNIPKQFKGEIEKNKEKQEER